MSTTDALLEKVNPAAAKKAVAVKATKEGSLLDIVTSKGFQKQMALALPKSLTAERLTRIIMSECRKTPELLNCSPASFYGSVLQCAQLGLEPGSALGHCYLLPFGNGKARDGRPNAQLIIGYRGMIDLARRSGQIVSLHAYCVHEKDDFHYELGLHPDIHHVPCATADRGPVTYVYAVAQLVGGGVQFEVMNRAEVEAVRAQSKAGTKGPWVSHWDEMAKKGLALDTPIPTPKGWTTMGDIKKGDIVFDKDGKQTAVTAVSEVKHLPCFKVTFSNGSSIVCDDEHRWISRIGGSNACRLPFEPKTVNELFDAKASGLSVTIPVQGALELPDANLPIDPYLLGYWLGDGSQMHAKITSDKDDAPHVEKAIVDAGYQVGTIRHDPRSNAVDIGIVKGFREHLEKLDLLANKHVPAEYLRASLEQRKALLAGLIDSDGHIDSSRGRASFCSTSETLRNAVYELLVSLGETPHSRDFLAKGFGKESMAYTVEWQPTFNPCRLERKAQRYVERKISPYLAIKSIEKVESVPTKCIAVDSPSRSYLCGRSMCVTHNTVIRRLFKLLPVSIEAHRAVEVDEKTDRGEAITAADVIDGIATEKGIDIGVLPEEESEKSVDPTTGEVKKEITDEDLLA